MATHCQTAAWSRSGECQNIGAVNSLEGKKRNEMRVVTCKIFTPFCEIHDIHNMKCFMEKLESLVYTIFH